MLWRGPSLCFAVLLGLAGIAVAQQTETKNTNSGAVELSTTSNPSPNGNKVVPVPQSVKPPALTLTDEQRQKIRKELSVQHNDLTLAATASPAEKDFTPSVGAAIPGPFQEKEEALPAELAKEVPALRQYTYLKFNKQILLIDPTTHKVVDQIPES